MFEAGGSADLTVEGGDAYALIAKYFTRVFRGMDIVPSDVVSGLILVNDLSFFHIY